MESGSTKAEERRVAKPDVARGERRSPDKPSVTDPQPIGEVARLWRTAAQSATIGMFVILAIVALSLARPVLLPVASAFVVTMMLGPLSARAERYKFPSLVSAIVLWLLVIGVFYGVIVLLASPVVDWIGKAPDIGRNIQEKLHVLDRPLAALQELRDALLPSEKKGSLGVDIASFVQPALLVVTPAIGQMFIFFGTLFFMLLGRSQLRRVLVVFFDAREDRLRMLRIMNDIEHNLTSYLSVVTVINIAVGILRRACRMGCRPAGSGGLGRAWIYPQLHSLYRRADHGSRIVHGRPGDVSYARACLAGAIAVPGPCNLGGAFYYPKRHRPQAHAQSAHRVFIAGFLGLAVGSGRRLSGGATIDHGFGGGRSSLPRG